VSRDFAREAGADRAIEVLDLVPPLPARLARDGGQHVGQHALGEFALVEGRIRGLGADVRAIRDQVGIRQQRGQVELALLGGLPRQDLEVLGAADEVGHARDA